MQWTGGCLCGRRRYTFDAELGTVSLCHCNMCKKATGGAFALFARITQDSLRWTDQPPATYRSSPIATRGFCPDCGSPLYLSYDNEADIHLTIGSFDHPEKVPRPDSHYGIESRLAWVDCWAGLPGEPTSETF